MNAVYVIAPALTVRTSPVADAFLRAFDRALSEYCSVTVLHSSGAMRMAEPDCGDVVVLFNRPDTAYEGPFLRFLGKAIRANAAILPVAATEKERHPPVLIENKQSFDVVELLRQRALDPSQVATVAMVFARQVFSILLTPA